MKTLVIDGETFEVTHGPGKASGNEMYIYYRPLPKPKKTLVEIAADEIGETVEDYRLAYPPESAAFDAIEERLKALEEAAKK